MAWYIECICQGRCIKSRKNHNPTFQKQLFKQYDEQCGTPFSGQCGNCRGQVWFDSIADPWFYILNILEQLKWCVPSYSGPSFALHNESKVHTYVSAPSQCKDTCFPHLFKLYMLLHDVTIYYSIPYICVYWWLSAAVCVTHMLRWLIESIS